MVGFLFTTLGPALTRHLAVYVEDSGRQTFVGGSEAETFSCDVGASVC